MNRAPTKTGLFAVRFLIYGLTVSLPLFHPSIEVAYDRTGWILWFFLIPAEMLAAFIMSPPRFKLRTWLLAAAIPLAVAFGAGSGFGREMLVYTAAAGAAFLSTAIHFRIGRGRAFAVLEVFLPGFIIYRLLGFTRASEEIAARSTGLVQLLLFLAVGFFIIHSFVLFRCAFPAQTPDRSRRESALMLAPLALLVAAALLLPPDFVEHSPILNALTGEIDPELIQLDLDGDGLPDGNIRGDEDGDDGQDGDRGERQQGGNRLEGINADQWDDRIPRSGQGTEEGGEQEGEGEGEGQGDREGPQRQYAVMIVGSEREPVYAADRYYPLFDPVRGFYEDSEERLNMMTFQRLIETWVNPEPELGAGREDVDVFFLSTIPDRALAYEPITVEPTILDRRYYPFSYSYGSMSAISDLDTGELLRVGDLTERERTELRSYLELPIPEEYLPRLNAHMEAILKNRDGYYAKIDGILKSFSTYQYSIGYTEDVSVRYMMTFLFDSKEGDCTEFSNSAAILGRLAGIPSRVVTGYLASRDLQTRAHRDGVRQLRDQIPALQSMPEESLYLVTNMQRHSWVQYYLPGYGWVDFESTGYAIPPFGSGDPNNMNVVIPILRDAGETIRRDPFPWQTLVVIVGFGIAAGFVGAYSVRYGREIVLAIRSRGSGTSAVRALYSLLLMKIAAEGREVKRPSETALEFSREIPETEGFASKYTELRYRDRLSGDRADRERTALRTLYRGTLVTVRRRGIKGFFRRIFSLKGLKY